MPAAACLKRLGRCRGLAATLVFAALAFGVANEPARAGTDRTEPDRSDTDGAPTDGEVVARVLGRPLTRAEITPAGGPGSGAVGEGAVRTGADREEAQRAADRRLVLVVRDPLLRAYAEREGLEPEAADVAAYVEMLVTPPPAGDPTAAGPTAAGPSPEPTPARAAAQRRVATQFATRILRELTVGEALWREHGGAVGFGSLGSCTPFVGQEALFRAEEEAGGLEFVDPAVGERFWAMINNRQQMADVVREDPQEIAEMFAAMRASFAGE